MKNNAKTRREKVESSKDKREDLRGEIRKLRKEVLQLRRENAKLMGRDMELQELLEEVVVEEVTIYTPSCPQCGSKNIKVMEKLRDDTDYHFCQNDSCGHRWQTKNEKTV